MTINKPKALHKPKKNNYVTLMIVPSNGTGQVISLKFTNSLKRGILIFILLVILATTSIITLSKLEVDKAWFTTSEVQNQLKNKESELENKENELENKKAANSELLYENEQIENSMKIQQELYDAKLQELEEKADEIEQKLQEIEAVKNELYQKLNSNDIGYDVQKHAARLGFAIGGPSILSLAGETQESLTLNARFDDIENSMNNLSSELDMLSAQIDDYLPYEEAYPSILPVNGRFTSYVGSRSNPFSSYSNSKEYHSGLDIAVDKGTSVKATGAGTVTYAGYDASYGYLVIIDHGYGIETRYGHNSSLLVKKGDTVKRGDIIAKSGSTGRSTGPHVHYEIRINDEIKNPLDYVKEEY